MGGRLTKAAAARTVLHAACWLAYAQPVGTASDIHLPVRNPGGQTTFRNGERNPLELSFSTSAPQKYQLNMATDDRSGRMNFESFTADPQTGWRDPLDLYLRSGGGQFGGGITRFAPLSAQPVVLPLDLNQWVRFDHPGDYRVTVQSHRAVFATQPARSAPVISNELRLTIVAASPEWQQETLQKALAVWNGPAPASGPQESRADAAKTLRYLGTEAAERAMAHYREDPDCYLGLMGSAFRAAGLDEMRKLLRDPAVPVDRQFLDTMALLAIPDTPGQHWQERAELQDRFLPELIAALPNKKGAAVVASVQTVMGNPRGVDPDVRRSLTDVLAANFDDLPIAMQSDLASNRYGRLDAILLVPMLRKMAERDPQFPQPQSAEAAEFNRLAGDALAKWYALDPADARPAMLREISRPTPRFPIDVLGILPDKELPEVDQALAAHFEAATDRATSRNLAWLIGRYATAAPETGILARLDRDLAAGICDTQAPLVAWLLRVDPERARPRLENGSPCRVSLAEAGKLQPGPILEGLATKGLDGPDAAAVADAAAYLAENGSASAEEALWSHLASWSKRWNDHENELRASGRDELAGQSLMQALITAQGWLMSDAKFRRLADLAVGAAMRQQVEQYARVWQQRPWLVRCTGYGQFQIGWYRAVSMKAAKEKLLQFPKGTEFRWIVQELPGEPADLHELAEFAMNNGLRLW